MTQRKMKAFKLYEDYRRIKVPLVKGLRNYHKNVYFLGGDWDKGFLEVWISKEQAQNYSNGNTKKMLEAFQIGKEKWIPYRPWERKDCNILNEVVLKSIDNPRTLEAITKELLKCIE